MQGQAVVDLDGPDYNGGKGTLASLLNDPARGAAFRRLKDSSGAWRTIDNVWVRYKPEEGPLQTGRLAIGFTGYGDKHHFGPELQFGQTLSSCFDGPILLIKTAWGGKSLYSDFRPPGAGGKVGTYYLKMLAEIREAIARKDAEFPALAGRQVVLAGLVWYQGWNDGCDPQHAVPEYEANLVHLIKDVRHDLQSPQLPVVVGELTGPWVEAPGEWADLRRAQSRAAARPEFRGNVLFVPTHDFVRRPEDSPNPTHGHHEFGNAETYLLVGDALARGMAALLGKASLFTSLTIDGWRVHIDKRLGADDATVLNRALGLLRSQLDEIVRVVPSAAVARLRKVTLWISPEYPGIRPTAEYHPDPGWLREHGRNPEMAKGVEFTNVRIFEAETKRMPNFALHELTHAYHDQVLGFDQPEIIAHYDKVKAAGIYNKVERWHGDGRPNTFEKAYAMTDHKEYFAESTEAFFGRNDFYPFDRKQLNKHDPQMESLLARLWGVKY
jgi:hypothetical protein